MTTTALARRRRPVSRLPGTDATAVLAVMPIPIIVVDGDNIIRDVNLAGEQLFQAGSALLIGKKLANLVAGDSPLFSMLSGARANESTVTDFDLTLDGPRLGTHNFAVHVSPMGDPSGGCVIALSELSHANKLDRQLVHRNAARSVTAMAAMLAHEIKNPLSGIRGAAQLLDQTANDADRELTQLICDEVDRIRALVDRMEVFSDARPLERSAVNIHEVLERVRRVGQNGFASHVRFFEHYDPSLPPVLGNRDLLVQVFLNLVKNAAEAVPGDGGEITLTTAYQHGISLAVPGSDSRVHLPLMVSIQDNGAGIPEDLQSHLFDPFVTTKRNGSGLGLALVAKVIGDHGGVVEFETQPRRTVFRVLLPIAEGQEATD